MSEAPSRDKVLEVAKAYAANALSAREMTAEQLRQRASAKIGRRFSAPGVELDPDVVASVVDEVVGLCTSYSMIDDAAYSSRRAEAGMRSGKSRRMTAFSLQSKGIDEQTAREGMVDYDELSAALNFLRKRKSGPYCIVEEDRERRDKVLGAFLRAGFGFSLWSRATAMDVAEAEEYLSTDPHER